MHAGSCLCGAVTFQVECELKAPDACHCSQCRKQSGHFWASTNVPTKSLSIEGEDKLTWFQSTEKVRRGFCSTCGSFLFWDPLDHDVLALALGAFDKPTGTKLHVHIFVDDKGDYYDLNDGLEQRPGY